MANGRGRIMGESAHAIESRRKLGRDARTNKRWLRGLRCDGSYRPAKSRARLLEEFAEAARNTASLSIS